MNKAELASYLVNLNTLLAAQTSNVSNPSVVLGAEYERVWALLKQEIKKDEARNSEQHSERTETGTEQQVGGPVRRG